MLLISLKLWCIDGFFGLLWGFWDLPRDLGSTGGEFITVWLGVWKLGHSGNSFCGWHIFCNIFFFLFFLNLIVFLRITFLRCGPPLVWVSSRVEQNQSWLQQRILGFSETLKVLGAAFWQSSKIQAQELEHRVITEPPSLMHPCAADYMSRSRLGFSHLWNGANNSISLIGVVWDGLGWWLDQAMSMNPLWYLDVILSHFLLLPLHHRHHHHHHHRHPRLRYDMGILSTAVPWHGMNRDNRTLDVWPKGSLEVTVTGLDSS